MIKLSLSDKERLVDELIKADETATVKSYLGELAAIQNELKAIEQTS